MNKSKGKRKKQTKLLWRFISPIILREVAWIGNYFMMTGTFHYILCLPINSIVFLKSFSLFSGIFLQRINIHSKYQNYFVYFLGSRISLSRTSNNWSRRPKKTWLRHAQSWPWIKLNAISNGTEKDVPQHLLLRHHPLGHRLTPPLAAPLMKTYLKKKKRRKRKNIQLRFLLRNNQNRVVQQEKTHETLYYYPMMRPKARTINQLLFPLSKCH